MLFFRSFESIRSSIIQWIIWEINSKKGTNVFCAPTETLVQGTNDANNIGQAFFWTVSCCINWVRQGGVLSPYLFAVYLDDLSIELNNIKAGCYVGEILLNHFMFVDDICVFCPSVRGLQGI